MQLISKFIKEFTFLCVIDIFSKYEWAVSLKDKKGTHPAKRRRGDVVTMSLCTSQRRRRYVSNETPNDVSVERRQDV